MRGGGIKVTWKKIYQKKKSWIGTNYQPLSANCSSLNLKNYHPGLNICV